jgi:hypothetical protein
VFNGTGGRGTFIKTAGGTTPAVLRLDYLKYCDKLAELMTIPNNYRQLKPNEIVRKGDLYRQERGGQVFPVKNSLGCFVGSYLSLTFWRRRHVKKSQLVVVPTNFPYHIKPKRLTQLHNRIKKVVTSSTKTETPKKNVTIVSFGYNYKSRQVQLISLDSKYLVGLEITRDDWSRYKYQFKKFLRSNIENHGTIYLSHFGPPLTN